MKLKNSPILLPPVIQPTIALSNVKQRVKRTLQTEQRPLDQLGGHRQILA